MDLISTMSIYLYTIASITVVSFISFAGAFALAIKAKKLEKITMTLVALSAGTLLGDVFFHLLPETIEHNGSLLVWSWILIGIIVFFILEKLVCWRHCHVPTSENHPHPLGVMNLIGDGMHNFLDGIIIAGSFLVSIPLGIATTLAVVAHEIPQEISDFGVLIHAGYSKSRALFLNFFSAMAAMVGAILTLIIGTQIDGFMYYIIPFTAGGFIYIATADLIPELHKETKASKSIKQLITIVIGIAIMLLLKLIAE